MIFVEYLQYLPVVSGRGDVNAEKEQTNNVLSKIFSKHSHEILNVGKVKPIHFSALLSGLVYYLWCLYVKRLC